MAKINLKKQVWHKYAISAGILVGATAIVLGSMYAFSKKSNEKLGRKSFVSENELSNIFIDKNAKPKTDFIEIHNNKQKIEYLPNEDKVVLDSKQISVEQYLDQYYKKHHALPYLNIKYGSFNFYNKYIEAVSPREFFKFTEWFMKNVSWGPEIITLKSFSIVKGVEMNGNSITLGSHSNKNKEYTTIQFFPDAFFGTLPIYSELSGRGNAQDSLAYKINKKVLTEPELREFLANISRYNSLSNISEKTIRENFFRNITNVNYLKGQKVFAIRKNGQKDDLSAKAFSEVEKNRYVENSPYLLVVAASNESEARKKLSDKISQYKNHDKYNLISSIDPNTVALEEKTISFAKIKTNTFNDTNKIIDKELSLIFDDGSSYNIHQSFDEIISISKNDQGQDIQNKLSNFKQFDGAIEQLKNDIEDLKAKQNEAIKSRVQNGEYDEKNIDNIISDLNKLQLLYTEFAMINSTINGMQEDVQRFSAAIEGLERLNAEVSSLDQEIKTIEKEIDDLKAKKEEETEESKKSEIESEIRKKTIKLEDLKQQLIAKKANQKAASDFLSSSEFINRKKELNKQREDLIAANEVNVKKLDDAIAKLTEKESKLKFNLQAEKQRIELLIKNAKRLLDDDLNILNKINESTSGSDLLKLLIDQLSENKKRSDELAKIENDQISSGMIFDTKKELVQKYSFIESEIENLVPIVTNFATFLNDNNINLLLDDSFAQKTNAEKVKILKAVDKKIFDTNSSLQGIITGREQNKKFVEKEYFFADSAYLPNQLISIESLVEASERAQLNWRDFYNIKQFANDRKNIAQNSDTVFFAYSKNGFKDARNSIKLPSDFDSKNFNEIELNKEKDALKAKKAELDQAKATINKKISLVYSLIKPFLNPSEDDENLAKIYNQKPGDYHILGSDEISNIFSNEDEFKKFVFSNPNEVSKYLQFVINGKNGTSDQSKIYGLKSLLESKSKDITSEKVKEYVNSIIEAAKKAYEDSFALNNDTSASAKAMSLISNGNLYKVINNSAEAKAENDGEFQKVDPYQLIAIVNAIGAFDQSIKLLNDYNAEYEQLKNLLVEEGKNELNIQRNNYQLNFLENIPSLQNSQVNQMYTNVLNEFNSKLDEYYSNISNNVSKKYELDNLISNFVNNSIQNSDFEAFASYDRHRETNVETLNQQLASLKTKKQADQEKLQSQKDKLEKASKELISALQNKHQDDQSSMHDEILKIANRIINFLSEFINPTDGKEPLSHTLLKDLNKKLSETVQQISQANNARQALLSSLESATDESKKDEINKQIKTIDLVIDRLSSHGTSLIFYINQVNFFVKWYTNEHNKLLEIKGKVERKEVPALQFKNILQLLDGSVSGFINQSNTGKLIVYRPLLQDLVNLKKALSEVNPPITLKYQLSTHRASRNYFDLEQSVTSAQSSLNELESEIQLLEKDIQNITKINSTSELKEQYDKYIQSRNTIISLEKEIKTKEDAMSSLLPVDNDFKINQPSEISTPLDEKINALNKAVNAEYEKDKAFSRIEETIKEIEDPNSSINKAKANVEAKEKEAGITDKLNEYKKLVDDFKNNINSFIKNYKLSLFIQGFKNVHGNIDSSTNRKYFISELESFDKLESNQKSLVKAFFSNLDAIKVVDSKKIVDSFNEINLKIIPLANELTNLNKKVAKEHSDYVEAINHAFQKNFAGVYNEFNNNDLTNPKLAESFSKLANLINDFNRQLNINQIADEEIKRLSEDFKNISQKVNKFVDESGPYLQRVVAYINSEAWTKNGEDFQREFYIRMLQPLVEYAMSEDGKTVVTDLKESISKTEQSDKDSQIQSLDGISTIWETLRSSISGEVKKLTPQRGVLLDPNDMFNVNYRQMKKSEERLNEQLKKLNDEFNSIDNFLDLKIIDVVNHNKLYEFYKKSLSELKAAATPIIKKKILETNRAALFNTTNDWTNNDDLIVAKSKIELIDILTKRGIFKSGVTDDQINQFIKRVDLGDVSKDGSKLNITLHEIDTVNPFIKNLNGIVPNVGSQYIKLSVDANADRKVLNEVDNLFSVLGYKKMVVPTLIKEQNEIKNNETNTFVKTYDVFASAYENLFDQLLVEVPYAGEWMEGLHIAKNINSDGVIEYKLENGKYLGFSKDSRVGLWAILKMSDPNFKGISTDFLKFVGAHEYGHHITLNGAHDLSNKGSNPIFVSALTPNATPNINNYYNKDVVDLYLKARTHVKLGTQRLLDEFGVIKDYGEYATFSFAKKDSDGKITFEDKPGDRVKSLEKESDIWGVELNSQDLRKALSNKNRRFLQDFAGMLQAVKSRREQNGLTKPGDEKWLSPFDLWVINAIDFYSGTLNPTVNSSFSKDIAVKYMYKNEKGEYKFLPASLSMLKGLIKDGLGNEIQFVEEKSNGITELVPLVVEGEKNTKGEYVIIHKVLMFEKNGSPIINVPLGVDLSDKNNPNYDPHAVKFVNEKINTVTNAIKSLVVDRFNINGWNTPNTRISVDPHIDYRYSAAKGIFGSSLPSTVDNMFKNIFRDQLIRRNPETGSYSDSQEAKFMKYYNNDGTVNNDINFPKRVPASLVYANPAVASGATESDIKFGQVVETLFTAGNSLNGLVNGGAGQILFINKDKTYIPNTKLDSAFTDMFFASTLPRDYLQAFNTKKLLRWLSSYTQEFIQNTQNQSALWSLHDKNGGKITVNRRNIRNTPFNDVAKIRMNYNMNIKQKDSDILNGLFGLIKNKDGNVSTSLEFTDYQEWLDFVTVDFSKAKYNATSKAVNWDMEYVKSKVDLDKFINDYKVNVLDEVDKNVGMSEKEKQAFHEFYNVAQADTSRQLWANEVMRRFSSSIFAMFTTNYSIEQLKQNPDLLWIFDKEHGYGEFKKSEFRIDSPNPLKWEIGKDQFINAYQKFADELGGVKLNQITLFDSLILDGKTQAYTDQTVINIALSKFLLIDIFLSIASGSFVTSPSQDVLDYFASKNERKFNELFSDYTYNFAEVINRDNLQITYSPSNHDFGNMPSFLSGINEANTGLEYIVDGTSTKKWLSKSLKLNDRRGRNGINNAILDVERLADEERKRRSDSLGLKYKQNTLSIDKNLNDAGNYSNHYFGDFQSINNGWFKDRWYRDFLDFKLYDDDGKDIQDDTIRIKDLEGNTVKSRARAYWQYYIQSQGVGKRNISTIWRDQNKDALAMFGYLSSDVADKANYLAFKNKETGEVKTLKITKQNTDNMFYYKSQHIENEKRYNEAKTQEERDAIRHTLKHEKYDYVDANGRHQGTGFVSWVSDYAIMAKYRNALLLPGSYSIYFSSDAEGQKDILNVDLGSWESIAENGKTFSQAPIRIERAKRPYKTDENGHKIYEYTLHVNNQFNGVK
ncbi:PDxFFG protein [Mycoplasma sp. U97]|uniref:PDxFFG protein n=1 Tax=Mycoplasma tauri TaxID=547987 RepID=UPI001CC15D23|nr:PDxFFG protein [Mycoplasma tauri]MBZ4212805.1 PDxFFG protein [Mycoplasma tauri]